MKMKRKSSLLLLTLLITQACFFNYPTIAAEEISDQLSEDEISSGVILEDNEINEIDNLEVNLPSLDDEKIKETESLKEEEQNTYQEKEVVQQHKIEPTVEEIPVTVQQKNEVSQLSVTDIVSVQTEAELRAELADIDNIPGETKVITITSNMQLNAAIPITLNHQKNVVIQGTSETVVLQAAAGQKHFTVNGTGAASLTFKNLTLKGAMEDSYAATEQLDLATITNATNGGGVVGTYINGEVHFDHVTFTQNKSARYTGNASAFEVNAKKATFEQCLFLTNFSGEGGAAIRLDSGNNENTILEINNTSFINNASSGSNIAGGAIYLKGGTNPATIQHSYFAKNQNKAGGKIMAGGGAIGIAQGSRPITIDYSVFKENSVHEPNPEDTGFFPGLVSDGGAFYANRGAGPLKITHSTFEQNTAYDEGGAVSFVLSDNPENLIENSTFVGNTSQGLQPADGIDGAGAIEISGNSSITSYATIVSNTFYDNTAEKGKSARGNKGAAVSYIYGAGRVENNLMSGNRADATVTEEMNFYLDTRSKNNVSVAANVIDQEATAVYGVLPFGLLQLGQETAGKAGSVPVQTIPIRPEGLADDVGVTDLSVDQNGHKRSTTNQDVGAIEIKWVKYVTNLTGSDWSLARPSNYDGRTYYETENPMELYQVYNTDEAVTTFVKPNEPEQKVFVGWNTEADGSGTSYSADTANGLIASENLTLYGQWEDVKVDTYHVYYDGNGANTGDNPVDAKEYLLEDTVAIQDLGNLSYSNHQFTGWNTKADGTGKFFAPNASFAVNEWLAEFNADRSMTLYAQWKMEEVPEKPILPNDKMDKEAGQNSPQKVEKEKAQLPQTSEKTNHGFILLGMLLVMLTGKQVIKNKQHTE
ncbi:InlB B-repeat-containing protein [Isobaculum melis]|uniref:LPXTG-motif cell wall anchor domain-containing protein n=1 Tax=Isobaculum melis TaxID=142588 RepID=A0A1H9QJX6_9LACT|nr:InlB B-repeat-containing protein [Isobaculum melis]SER60149.1 LPXTG-motif cell wall anchor domain-containing protein [Isobaculum melis]